MGDLVLLAQPEEQRQRAHVLIGLFPLLDVLVRGRPGQVRSDAYQDAALEWPSDLLVLFQLELATYTLSDVRLWRATSLGRDVYQQLAVLRYEGIPGGASSWLSADVVPDAWRTILASGWRRTDRGTHLLQWLRLGSEARCRLCDRQAVGLRCRGGEWTLACEIHRTVPRRASRGDSPTSAWHRHALALGLAGGVP